MKVDMSPQAVTDRMIALDQLWELAIALKSSKIVHEQKSIDVPKLTKKISTSNRITKHKSSKNPQA